MNLKLTAKQRLDLMGKIVTVTRVYRRSTKTASGRTFRAWQVHDVKPRAGWVVGFRSIQEGYVNRYEYFDGLLSDEGPGGSSYALDPTNFIPCILVSYWYNMRPENVPLDAFSIGGEPYNQNSWGEIGSETREYNIELQKKIMHFWPRDKKGRWVPWESIPQELQNKIGDSYKMPNSIFEE